MKALAFTIVMPPSSCELLLYLPPGCMRIQAQAVEEGALSGIQEDDREVGTKLGPVFFLFLSK